MRVLRLAEVGQGEDLRVPELNRGNDVAPRWECVCVISADCVGQFDEVFFAHLCVSVCVLLFVFVCLQCQEEEPQGEDKKNGEDFAAKSEEPRTGTRAAVLCVVSHNV
jgi:hypothetical protein